MLNLTERLEDASEHVFSDVKVQRANVESHRTVSALAQCWQCTAGNAILLGLSRLYDNRNAEQFLSRQSNSLEDGEVNLKTFHKL